MQSLKSLKSVHWLVIAVAVAAVAFASFYFTKAEAVYSHRVGTISVTKFVPNAGGGYEFVTLDFGGIFEQDSTADLDGWSLQSDNGFSYDLSSVVLTKGTPVTICEEDAIDSSCTYHWDGNDVFVDEKGILKIVARDTSTVINITYSEAYIGEIFQGSSNYYADVYTAGDKIGVCVMQKNGAYKARNVSVMKLTNDIDRDIAKATDIVPPFVYERNKVRSFHPGINWPDGKDSLLNNCR